MNERIKELAIQADIKFLEFHGKEYCEAWVEQQEKFAELIVRECVEVAHRYDEPKLSGPGLMIGGMIEEHFGVEE